MSTKVKVKQFNKDVITDIELQQRFLVFKKSDGSIIEIDLGSANASINPPVVFFGQDFSLHLQNFPNQFVTLAEIRGIGADNVGPFTLDGKGSLIVPYKCTARWTLGLHEWKVVFSDGQECLAQFIVAGAKYHPIITLNKYKFKQGENLVYNISGAKPLSVVARKKIDGGEYGELAQGEADFPYIISIDENGRANNVANPEKIPDNALGTYNIKFLFADGHEQRVRIDVEQAIPEQVYHPIIVTQKTIYDIGDQLVWYVTQGKPKTAFTLFKQAGDTYPSIPNTGIQYTLNERGEYSNFLDSQNKIPDGAKGSYTFKAVFFDNQESSFNITVASYNPTFTYDKTTVTIGGGTLTWNVNGAKPNTQVKLIKVNGPDWNGKTETIYSVDSAGKATNTETITTAIKEGQYVWRCEFWDMSKIEQTINVLAAPIVIPPTGGGNTGGNNGGNTGGNTGGGTTTPVNSQFNFNTNKYVQPAPISIIVKSSVNTSFIITQMSGPSQLFTGGSYTGTTNSTGEGNINVGASSQKTTGHYKFKCVFSGQETLYQEIDIVSTPIPGALVISPPSISRNGIFTTTGSTKVNLTAYYNKRGAIAKIERISGPSVTGMMSSILGGGSVYMNNADTYPNVSTQINSSGQIIEDGKTIISNGCGVGTYVIKATFDNGTTATATFTITN